LIYWRQAREFVNLHVVFYGRECYHSKVIMAIDTIFSLAVLVMSVVVHEVSHGYAALALGDQTARFAGRLTLNPLRHLDPVGSILVPLFTSLSGFTFGWARPVPYNPYNLRNKRWGEAMVAGAGPLSNIAVALVFGLLLRAGTSLDLSLPAGFSKIAALIVLINLMLAIFNLMPIPPLDGSKILFSILPYHLTAPFRGWLERYGLILVIVFIFFLWELVSPFVGFLFRLFTGGSF